MLSNKRQQGFTIVELLIVIVVIAIIAVIVIILYNGLQQKARNTLRVNIVGEYVKMLTTYALNNDGAYPTFTNGACFGTGYSGGECTNNTLTQTFPTSATEQAAFNSQLATVGKVPNFPGLNANAYGPGDESGAFIYNRGVTNESLSRSYRLVYFLEGGNEDCGQQRIIRATNGASTGTGGWTVGVFSNSQYKNTNPGGSTYPRTMCMISLLNPNEQ